MLLFFKSWQNLLQRWISCWKVVFWGMSALYQSKILAMSADVIVAIVRGTSLDSRSMSVLSAGKRWSKLHKTMVNIWKENIHFKVQHSHVIDFSSSWPMSHSSCRSLFLHHWPTNPPRKLLSFLRSLMTFLQVFASHTPLQYHSLLSVRLEIVILYSSKCAGQQLGLRWNGNFVLSSSEIHLVSLSEHSLNMYIT